jgi:hypothetical protein
MIEFDDRLQILGSPDANTPSKFSRWYRVSGFVLGGLVAALVVVVVRAI